MCSSSKTLLLASMFGLLIGFGAVGFTHPELIGLPGEPKAESAPAPVTTNVSAVAAPQAKAPAKGGCGSSGSCCCAAKAKKCCCGDGATTAKMESTVPVTTVRNIGLLSSPQGSFAVAATLTMAPVVETK